jgi:hypothetical protein
VTTLDCRVHPVPSQLREQCIMAWRRATPPEQLSSHLITSITSDRHRHSTSVGPWWVGTVTQYSVSRAVPPTPRGDAQARRWDPQRVPDSRLKIYRHDGYLYGDVTIVTQSHGGRLLATVTLRCRMSSPARTRPREHPPSSVTTHHSPAQCGHTRPAILVARRSTSEEAMPTRHCQLRQSGGRWSARRPPYAT